MGRKMKVGLVEGKLYEDGELVAKGVAFARLVLEGEVVGVMLEGIVSVKGWSVEGSNVKEATLYLSWPDRSGEGG